jgi:hypothetical protein
MNWEAYTGQTTCSKPTVCPTKTETGPSFGTYDNDVGEASPGRNELAHRRGKNVRGESMKERQAIW